METTTAHTRSAPHSLLDLITGLREDVRILFHQEIHLAKTEISEKASRAGRNAAYLVVGVLIAYLALNLVLIGLSYLLALGFETLGLSTGLALFLGFSCLAIVMGIAGAILVVKAIQTFKTESMVPEKTLESLKELKSEGLGRMVAPQPPQNSNSQTDQIRSHIEDTRGRIGQEMAGIHSRLRVATLAARIAGKARAQPLRMVGFGLGAGYLLMRVTKMFVRRRAA